jgi:hypothetical protein
MTIEPTITPLDNSAALARSADVPKNFMQDPTAPPVAKKSSTVETSQPVPAAVPPTSYEPSAADALKFFRRVHHGDKIGLSWGLVPAFHGLYGNPEDATDAALAAQMDRGNTWYRINTAITCTGQNGSMQDSDVVAFNAIAVDGDPPPLILSNPEALRKWQDEIAAVFLALKATTVHCSGRGIQALFVFESPLPATDKLWYMGAVKFLAKKLKDAGYPADPKVFNPSRLMKVPLGNAVKDSKTYPIRIYTLDGPLYTKDHPLFAGVQIAADESSSASSESPEESVVKDILTPELKAPPYLRELITAGPSALRQPKYGGQHDALAAKCEADESDGVLHLVVHLQAANNPDDLIKKVMMTPGTWTERNLSNKKDPQRELRRKFETGIMEKHFPYLVQIRDWNRKHAVIKNFGGRCGIRVKGGEWMTKPAFLEGYGKEIRDNWKLESTDTSSATAPKKWINRPAEKPQPLASVWFNHELTTHYAQVVRQMHGHCDPDDLNLWPGWSVKAAPGDWGLLKTHILKNLCREDQTHYDFFIKWMAYGVQKDGPMHSFIVLYGIQGSGKSVLTDSYKSLWKESAPDILEASQVAGEFTATLLTTNVVVLSESTFYGDVKQSNYIKGLVTSPTLNINRKFKDEKVITNSLRIFVCSNENFVIRADPDSRRPFVLKTVDRRMPKAERDAIIEQLDNGGRAAMLHELQTMKLGDFVPTNPPATPWLEQQQSETEMLHFERSNQLDGRIHTWLDEEHVPAFTKHGTGCIVKSSSLVEYLASFCHMTVSPHKLSSRLETLCGATLGGKYKRERVIELPDLKTAREKFAMAYPQSAKSWAKDINATWRFESATPWTEQQQEFES